MRKLFILSVLAVLGVAGCKEAAPTIQIEKEATGHTDAVASSAAQTAQAPAVTIVTGEPAVMEEEKDAHTAPLKDEPGAVAVKMDY